MALFKLKGIIFSLKLLQVILSTSKQSFSFLCIFLVI